MLVATGSLSILTIHIAAVTVETEGSMAMQIIHMIAMAARASFSGLDRTMKCRYGEGGTAMTGGSDVVMLVKDFFAMWHFVNTCARW